MCLSVDFDKTDKDLNRCSAHDFDWGPSPKVVSDINVKTQFTHWPVQDGRPTAYARKAEDVDQSASQDNCRQVL